MYIQKCATALPPPLLPWSVRCSPPVPERASPAAERRPCSSGWVRRDPPDRLTSSRAGRWVWKAGLQRGAVWRTLAWRAWCGSSPGGTQCRCGSRSGERSVRQCRHWLERQDYDETFQQSSTVLVCGAVKRSRELHWQCSYTKLCVDRMYRVPFNLCVYHVAD